MCTSNWEKFHFENCKGKDGIADFTNPKKFSISLGPYEVRFDMERQCSENFGVKIFNTSTLGLIIDYKGEISSETEEQIERVFEGIEKCKIFYLKDSNSFRIYIGGGRAVEFYNKHNGYYSHNLEIFKGDTRVFYSSL